MKIKSKSSAKLLVIFILFLLMADAVQATNLGTVQKQSVRTIRKGETAEFTILFWNLDEPVLPVKLKLRQAPEKWTVIINPEVFTLNQSKPENPPYQEGVEYIGASNNLIIRTTPIKIYVKVPTSAKEGAYEILITANAGTTNDAISVLQERTFKFVVNVKKSSTFFDTFANIGSAALEFSGDVADKITDSLSQSEVENKISKITEGVKLLTGKLAENISFNIFYVIISVCILVVSLIIYKYA